MGYPYLKVVSEEWTDASLKVTLEQNWFLADGSAVTEEEVRASRNTCPIVPVHL